MIFEWDEAKRLANLNKHGVDFADALEFDWEGAIMWLDDRKDYGEERLLALGFFRGAFTASLTRNDTASPASSASAKRRSERYGNMKKKKINLDDYSDDPIDDSDNPEWTEEMFRNARPLREVDPKFVKAVVELRKRGRPPLEHPKVQVTLRVDEEVLNAFKEDGPGWQGRINEELKKTVKRRKKAR